MIHQVPMLDLPNIEQYEDFVCEQTIRFFQKMCLAELMDVDNVSDDTSGVSAILADIGEPNDTYHGHLSDFLRANGEQAEWAMERGHDIACKKDADGLACAGLGLARGVLKLIGIRIAMMKMNAAM